MNITAGEYRANPINSRLNFARIAAYIQNLINLTEAHVLLQIHQLTKSYTTSNAPVQILQGASLQLSTGMSASIQGASGSGKSSLLNMLGALDSPNSGKIIFTPKAHKDIHVHALNESQADEYRRKHVGFVFQKFNLIECLNVRDNISLPSRLNRLNTQQDITHLVEVLQISQHLDKYPSQLSGGEQQRVAIARALAHRPSLVLADEPTGNLDEHTSHTVSDLLFNTCRDLQTSLIVVTHSDNVAKQADLRLKLHDRKLEE